MTPDPQELAALLERCGVEARIQASCMAPETGCPYPEEGASYECPQDCPYFGKEPKPLPELVAAGEKWCKSADRTLGIKWERDGTWSVMWFQFTGAGSVLGKATHRDLETARKLALIDAISKALEAEA